MENTDVLSWKDIRDHLLWWLRLAARSLSFARDVMTRYKRISWPLMLAGAGLAVGALYLKSKVFTMTTTYVYGDLHPKIFGDMIDKLNALIWDNRTGKAAEVTGLTEEQAGQLLRFEVTDSRGRPLSNNYTLHKEPLILTVDMRRAIDEDSLRTSISSYFNGNPFTADRMEMKKKLLRDELTFIDGKLETIDTVLTNLYAGDTTPAPAEKGVTVESSEGKNAYELLNFSRELMKRKTEIENNLSFPENVIPIDNFLVLPKARMTPVSLAKSAVAGAVAGFLLAGLFLLFRIHVAVLVGENGD